MQLISKKINNSFLKHKSNKFQTRVFNEDFREIKSMYIHEEDKCIFTNKSQGDLKTSATSL